MIFGRQSMKAYVYSKVPVAVSLQEILRRWPREAAARNLKRLVGNEFNPMVTCVSMLAHPLAKDGTGINTKKVVEIMCIAPGYTVYKKAADNEEGEEWNLAASDSYNIFADIDGSLDASNVYRRVRVRPVVFLSERDAHEIISGCITRARTRGGCVDEWFDNSHGIIDEFVYKTSMMPCGMCPPGVEKKSGRRFEGGMPLCASCRPTKRYEGDTIQIPKIIDLGRLPPPLAKRVFTKENVIDQEYVTFFLPEDLPYTKGCEVQDAGYTEEFIKESRTAVYDIETITVDSTLTRTIPDEVVTITVSTNTGGTTKDLVMFTRKVPDSWCGGDVDTNEFLGDLRKEGQLPLPKLKVIRCSSERSLLEGFRDFLQSYRPHFLVSYNGHGFDNKYLIRGSVATRMDEPFHKALDHLTPLVRRMQSKDPLRTVGRGQFMRPHGKFCSGMLADTVMEVGYDTFPGMLSIDLYPINDMSLNDACKKKKVDGCKLEGVSHTDIPRLYYGRHEDFFRYAVLDVVITTDLLWKDRFDAIELFMELEKLVGTPWNMTVSRQKTMSAITTTYIQFNSNGFLRKAIMRPKRILSNAVVDELASYFGSGVTPRLDETFQLTTDFANGHCKCNTLIKALPKDQTILTEGVVHRALGVQVHRKRATDPPYSTVDAAILLFYLFRGGIDWKPFQALLNEYGERAGPKHSQKRVGHLKNFVLYLVRVRKCLSPLHECPELLWKAFRENHKTDLVVTGLKEFVEEHHGELMGLARKADRFARPTEVSPAKVASIIKEKFPQGIKLKMLSYDGALIICPKSGVNMNNPVCALDFRSQYPNGMRVINLGVDTHMNVATVMKAVSLLQERRGGLSQKEAARVLALEYVHVCPTRRVDDTTDWTDYLGHLEYLERNCIFFVKNAVSIQNHQFKAEIDSRVEDKFKAENPSLTPEERASYAKKSAAKKININSRYGLIQSVVNPRFQPTVTGVGRRSIQTVTKKLRDMLGTSEMYGDSVPGYTPLTVRDSLTGRVGVITFDSLPEEKWVPYPGFAKGTSKKQQIPSRPVQVMTEVGWRAVVRFVSHKTVKKMYRVATRSGIVDVTEDHSLLDPSGAHIKPTDVVVGQTELLRVSEGVSYTQDVEAVNRNMLSFLSNLVAGDTAIVVRTQVSAQAFCVHLNHLGYDVTVTDDNGIFRVRWLRDAGGRSPNVVTKVTLLHEAYAGCVFDVETDAGTFNAGIGDIVIKNTDSCFTFKKDLDVFEMAKMTPLRMYELLKFQQFAVSFTAFKETIYDRHYPVDESDPKAVRQSGGGVFQQLYEVLAPILSTDALELEAEKTLCPMTLPSMKKYTAFNCVTGKTLTKGLSCHNKGSFGLSKDILEAYNNIVVRSRDRHDMAAQLYHHLGRLVTVPIELGLVDLSKIAKPTTINIKKVKSGSKKDTLLKRMEKESTGCFMYEKIHTKVVSVYPEDDGLDAMWSLRDIGSQKCSDEVHVIKTKFDVLQEIMTIVKSEFQRGVCEVFERLIWGDYEPDYYTAKVFEKLSLEDDAKFTAMSFTKIMSKRVHRARQNGEGGGPEDTPAVVAPSRPKGKRKRPTDSGVETHAKKAKVDAFWSAAGYSVK